MRRKTNEEFLQELVDKNIPYIPLDEYIKLQEKIRWECHKCHNIFSATPANVLRGKGCPYCKKSGSAVAIGFNDMWTTNPELAKMLLNSDDGYKYREHSNCYTDWVCPICNSIIRNKRINFVCDNGLACPCCSTGISYPEKFISNMLNQLNIDFIHDRAFDWSNDKRYDFYIESLSLIIETHGYQHYSDGFYNTSKWQKQNDKYKQNLAFDNGIKLYIQLDCSKSNKEYIYNSIINSQLADIFDLTYIDWDECNYKASNNSDVVDACNLWKAHYNTKTIAQKMQLSQGTIIEYLKRGAAIGLCEYNSKENLGTSKMCRCIETQKIYKKIKDTERDGFSPVCVGNCCNGKQSNHKGYHFEFYEEVS